MDITVKNLGIISPQGSGLVKFVLLDEAILLFGKCEWHRDLIIALYGEDVPVTIIAAGVLPKDVSKVSLNDEYWGDWKSSGYGVVTPSPYKRTIKDSLLSFEQEINHLWE